MRAVTSKTGDHLTHFDKIDESQAKNNKTSLKNLLDNNHDIAASRGKNKAHAPLELFYGFCRTVTRTTKQLEFHLSFKTADLQDTIHTILGDVIKVNFDKIFLFLPLLIPDASTQIMLIHSFINISTLSFDS